MTDWTIILTSVGVATVTGALGYLGARAQASVSRRQIEAENERLREQHREDHLRNREGTYHRFLTAIYELDNLAVRAREKPEEDLYDEFVAWRTKLNELYAGIMLSGAGEVSDRASDFMDALLEHGQATKLRPDASALQELETKWRGELGRLLEAMRADVAPS